MIQIMARMLARAKMKAVGEETSWVELRGVYISYYPRSGTHRWWDRNGPISAVEAEKKLAKRLFTIIFREHYGDVYEVPVWAATWHHAIRRALALIKVDRDDVILCHNQEQPNA